MGNLLYMIKALRKFFEQQSFEEILTPPLVSNPGMETHIHPFQVFSAHQKKTLPLYLHTSPEFHMKNLLSQGWERLYTLSYSFRDEPVSETHRPQFLLLEWYRTNARYESLMQDCQELVDFAQCFLKNQGVASVKPILSFEKATVQELFQEFIQTDILQEHPQEIIQKNDPKLLPEKHDELLWEDYFFLLWLNKIEPQLKNYPYLLVYEYPAPLAALSTLKTKDPRVCERFEVYMHGLEIANAFNELCDLEEQKKRFQKQAKDKESLYGYKLPEAELLYQALEKRLPPSAGIAWGVERFLMALTGNKESFYNDLSN